MTPPVAATPAATSAMHAEAIPVDCGDVGVWRDQTPFFQGDIRICEARGTRWIETTFDTGSVWVSPLRWDGQRMVASTEEWFIITSDGTLQVWDADGLIKDLPRF